MIGNPTPPGATGTSQRYVCRKPFKKVFCFKITLQVVEPAVWRRVEVPDSYTFWDLHVAITDVFGWMDYHLHEFQIANPKTGKPLRLGIPDDESFDELDGQPPVKPDWQKELSSLFTLANRTATHLYDFGDGWEHLVELEEIRSREEGVAYPRCRAGERAGPPEDCGGPYGYQELLKTIQNPRHKEHKRMVGWLREMKGPGFDPNAFDPGSVRFDDPLKRWKVAFDGGEITPDLRCWEFFKKEQTRDR